MPVFNLKLFTFYAMTITSVIVIFKTVTTYGETILKAPSPIGGHYLIAGKNLPGCLKNENLVLLIQQSGIYLNGSLSLANSNEELKTKSEENPSLVGKWKNQNLILSGTVPHLIACNGNSDQGKGSSSKTLVNIQGVIKGESLTGKISVSSASEVVDFSAQREAVVKEEKKVH
jgi:hypothetical protein